MRRVAPTLHPGRQNPPLQQVPPPGPSGATSATQHPLPTGIGWVAPPETPKEVPSTGVIKAIPWPSGQAQEEVREECGQGGPIPTPGGPQAQQVRAYPGAKVPNSRGVVPGPNTLAPTPSPGPQKPMRDGGLKARSGSSFKTSKTRGQNPDLSHNPHPKTPQS